MKPKYFMTDGVIIIPEDEFEDPDNGHPFYPLILKNYYDVTVGLLMKFAHEDFRGNRPQHSIDAYNLLKDLGEL